jgi:hypothetical protein
MVDAMTALTIAGVEKACDANGITLVMHPAVRRAIRAYQESFYIGACSFLRGESDGLYFVPIREAAWSRYGFRGVTPRRGTRSCASSRSLRMDWRASRRKPRSSNRGP